jgi:hypothetical protein
LRVGTPYEAVERAGICAGPGDGVAEAAGDGESVGYV